ncbi:hypothetical protein NDU88_002379 [Pleurodeles waltl]|uniref:Uncharacterized protein n=1 Tax=Pleurodeles waltl TaxID=8319 RepID=A0AAV7P6L4_PLEWA|nr:hypothetical protein NDU88_002379 [Pleurodeles waltl]
MPLESETKSLFPRFAMDRMFLVTSGLSPRFNPHGGSGFGPSAALLRATERLPCALSTSAVLRRPTMTHQIKSNHQELIPFAYRCISMSFLRRHRDNILQEQQNGRQAGGSGSWGS